MLRLDLPTVAVPQGASFSGALWLDAVPSPAAALVLELELPALQFASVTLQRGAGLAGGAFEAAGPTGGRGAVRVVIEPSAPLAAPAELLRFDATASGPRGSESLVRAHLVSGADADLIPFEPELVEATVLVASGAPGVLTGALDRGHVGQPYHGAVLAEGGAPPYRFGVVAGGLPPGLSLDPAGILSGTPTAAGTFDVTLGVADGALPPATAVRRLSLEVTEPLPSITTRELPLAAPGHAYAAALAATGGRAPLTWRAENLPPGLAVVGDRIEGVPAPVAHGDRAIVLSVEDASVPPLTARRTVPLSLRPALQVASIAVPGVEALVVAPNLLVVDYEVDADVSVAITDPVGTRETTAILDRALDEVIAEIVTVDCGPGLEGPRGPPPRDPGDPGRPPRRPSRAGCREQLLPLLDEYRNLRAARSRAQVLAAGVSVAIDGVVVVQHLEGVRKSGIGRRAPKVLGLVPSPETQAIRRELARRPGPLLKRARARLARLVAASEARKEAGRGALSRKRREVPPRRWIPGERVESLVDARLDALDELLDELDWSAPWAPGDRTVVPLTTGPHRVEVSAFASVVASPGSVIGATAAASAAITSRVTLRARNPERMPRLEGEVVVTGVGTSWAADVELHPSNVDVLATDATGLALLPATGDPGRPYGRARPLQRRPASTPARLHAAVADDLGRTWVFAATDREVTVIRNAGVGGFAEPVTWAVPAGEGTIRAVDTLDCGGSHVELGVLLDRAFARLRGLEGLAVGATLAPTLTALRSPVVNDLTGACCRVPAADGTDVAIAVTWRGSGVGTWHELGADGSVGAHRPLAPLDTVALDRRAPAIAVCDADGRTRLAAIAPEARELIRWELAAAARPELVASTVDVLPAVPHQLAPALGLGVALLLGPEGQVFFLAESLVALDPRPGTTAMHGRGPVLALARREHGEVAIFERR